MSHMHNDKKSNVFGAVLVAGLVGAVAGLLMAPKRGVETREDIRRKVNDVKNKTQDKAMDAHEKLNDGLESAKGKLHEATGKSKNLIDKAAGKAKDGLDRANDKGVDMAEEIQKEDARRNRPLL